MRDAFTSRVRAGYCRLIVANPLHPGLPKLILMVQATCNRFKAEDVRNQWTRLDQLWNRAGGVNLRTILGPLIGHGSDGDARRFKLQLEDMSSKVGNRFSIAWGGLTLTGVRGKDGNVRALHSQDPIHNSKKGINPLDVASRRLQLGGFLVIWEHLCLVMNRFPPDKHGLKAGDKAHFDRQDFRLVQRVVAPDVRTCLRELRPEHQTQGTETWLEVMYMYLTAHFSDTLTVEERVENLACVLSFARLWRNWVAHSTYNLTDSFLSRQAFEHICLSCQSAILKVKLCHELGAELYLDQSGSDACETIFSVFGGCGKILTSQRNYCFNDVLEMAGNQNQMNCYRADPNEETSLTFRRHRKTEWFLRRNQVWSRDAQAKNIMTLPWTTVGCTTTDT